MTFQGSIDATDLSSQLFGTAAVVSRFQRRGVDGDTVTTHDSRNHLSSVVQGFLADSLVAFELDHGLFQGRHVLFDFQTVFDVVVGVDRGAFTAQLIQQRFAVFCTFLRHFQGGGKNRVLHGTILTWIS
ncbi:hypothetical protein D3C77_563040 [compost metagenome]